jgi:signal transduction histidine kinase
VNQPVPSDILVVDDHPGNLAAIEVALETLGYNLFKARSGAEALRRLLEQDFALILLDVQMPGMSGFEAARLIRERDRTRGVPIIFISAYDRDDAELLEAYRLGAVDFLFKPIRPEILQQKASVLVELQRRTAEVERQAAQLREHARLERERALAEQRQALEAEALRQRLAERDRHAAELLRMNERLALDDRRKDEFMAVLGHELLNPLAPLVNGLALLEGSRDDVVERARRVMKRQVEHLTLLVNDLLDMSRVTLGKIELRRKRVSVGDVIDQALALAQPLLDERRHRLSVVCDVRDVFVEGDEVRLTQILANLLNNAARYTDPGGQIELHGRRHVSTGDAGNQQIEGVELRVKDNGRGISPELLPRVFELFVQERSGGGLGIGLTLVKQLVTMHGGRVDVVSAGPGLGSEFTVWLPGASAPAPSVRPPKSGTSDVARALKVALVEDNDDVRSLMCELLMQWGHTVSEAATGEQGVSLIVGDPPDIAFVDIGLPDMEGYEVARQVRAALGHARPRLVALSGFGQQRDRERASDAGFDEHLVKPAAPDALRRLLDAVSASASGAQAARR